MQRHLNHLAVIKHISTLISGQTSSAVLLDEALRVILAALPIDLAAWITLGAPDSAPQPTLDSTASVRAALGWDGLNDADLPDAVLANPAIRAALYADMLLTTDDDDPGALAEADPDALTADDAVAELAALAQAAGFANWALVPMHARGSVNGGLLVFSSEPPPFAADEIAVLRIMADQVGTALDYALLAEQAAHATQRLHAIATSTSDALIATDRAGRINLVNATAETLFNLRLKRILGLPLHDAPLHPVIRRNLVRAMQNSARGSTVFEVMLDDGRFLSVVVVALFDTSSAASGSAPNATTATPNGHTTASNHASQGWLIVVRDMTALRHAEQARTNFIHAAAHDLRNPLGVAMGAISMLQQTLGEESDFHREIVGIGVEGITRMEHLIGNLLDLEKLERGTAITALSQIEIGALIEHGLADIQPFLNERGQELRLELAAHLPPVRGDLHWLSHALRNLLRNASKYAPAGGTVGLRTYIHDGEMYIEVEDNGPGIPSEAQSRLFERFYRITYSNEERGSGLGLAIVKSVVEQHNGRVFLQSEPGAGSLFGIVLPCPSER